MEKNLSGRLVVSSSEKSADLLYLSGFNAPDAFVYFETENTRAIVVSELELARAGREAAKGVRVINRADILRNLPEERRNSAHFLSELSKYANVTHWIVPADFPLHEADLLRENGLEVECAAGEFCPRRAIKREDELESIRQSELMTQDAMFLVRDMLSSAKVNAENLLELHGRILTCDEIRAEVESFFKRHSFSAARTIIACGKDAAAPHCIGSGPVRAHEPVVADIFPRSDITGYWGDMTRTFCKGAPSPIVRKAFEAVKAASDLALSHLRAGIPGIVIHQLAGKSMEEAGFPTGIDAQGNPRGFIHGLGHGVGLEIHESPRVSPSNPNPLQENAVVSIEPGLYDFAWGGIRLEDLVVVRKDGYENLCSMPKELEIP